MNLFDDIEDYQEEDPKGVILGFAKAFDDYAHASVAMKSGIASKIVEDALILKALQFANYIDVLTMDDPHYSEMLKEYESDLDTMQMEATAYESNSFYVDYFLEIVVPAIITAILGEEDRD